MQREVCFSGSSWHSSLKERCAHSFSRRLLRALLQQIGCYMRTSKLNSQFGSPAFRTMQGKQLVTGSSGFHFDSRQGIQECCFRSLKTLTKCEVQRTEHNVSRCILSYLSKDFQLPSESKSPRHHQSSESSRFLCSRLCLEDRKRVRYLKVSV